jgi:hypothetical protein
MLPTGEFLKHWHLDVIRSGKGFLHLIEGHNGELNG